MPKHYDERYGRAGYRRDRDRADDRGYSDARHQSDERGYMDRASDEVRSWFGDDEAQRRRQMDEQRERLDESRYGRDWNRSDRSDWGGSRNREWDRSDWNRSDWNRSDWNRSDASRGDWDRDRSSASRSEWNRADSNRGDWARGDWNRSENNRSDWNRQSSQRDDWGQGDWDRPRASWMYAESTVRYRDPNAGSGRSGSSWDTDRGDSREEGLGRANRYESPERRGHAWTLDEGRTEFGSQRWGRGPKGYQRPDARIHEDICDRLTYSDVDAEHVEVKVENGEVTLSGTVRDRWDKRRAEDVAEQISGVRDVHNNIRVQRERDRGIGQSETSATDQPGTVLGVNPTAEAHIKSAGTKGTPRS